MADTIILQNIVLSSWITLYISAKISEKLRMELMLKHPRNSESNQYITDCTSPPNHKPLYKPKQALNILL